MTQYSVSNRHFRCLLLSSAISLTCFAEPSYGLNLKLSHSLSLDSTSQTAENSKTLFNSLGNSLNQGITILFKIGENLVFKPTSKLPQLALSDRLKLPATSISHKDYKDLLPASWPVSFHSKASGVDFYIDGGNKIVIGDIVNPHQPNQQFSVRGMHWVNRLTDNSSFVWSIQKSSSDAKELRSGFGLLYDLD